jgi:hypothetical protein
MPPQRTQTRGAENSSAGSLLGSWVLELCLGKEEAGTCKVLEKFLTIESTESLSFCKNSFGNTIGAPKTASAGERPASSLGCARSPRSTKSKSSDDDTTAARARSASLRRRYSLSTAPFNSRWYAVAVVAKLEPKIGSKLWPMIRSDCFWHSKM